MRMPSAVSKEWVCMCKLCKLYPGRECDTGTDNWPGRVVAPKMGASREEKKNETEERRFRSALTWNPLRKRSISPQGGTIRCRNVAAGGCRSRLGNPSQIRWSRTAEDWGRLHTMREKLARWPRVDSLEKDHLSQIWSRMEWEQGKLGYKGRPAQGGQEGHNRPVKDEAKSQGHHGGSQEDTM